MFVCALALAGAAASACGQPVPAAQPAAPADAAQVYAQACAKCHGADGAGGLPMATNGPKPIDFRDPQWQRGRSDADIVAAIRNGRGAMPPFEGVLTGEQVDSVARYLRSLK